MADMTSSASAREYLRQNFFFEQIEISETTRKVLEGYSNIPPDQVVPHVYAVREKAFAIHPYPCIGMGRFLDLAIGKHVLYPEILSRMKSGDQAYLDLGCAFAQDIRRLVADGVDSKQCYGSDLRLDFIDLGYELFNDKSTLQSQFIAADIFDPQSSLHELEGTFDIIGASSFFHLFGIEDQRKAAIRVAQLLKPQPGSMVVGRQMGNLRACETQRKIGTGARFRHSLESWAKLWEDVGQEMGIKFKVESTSTPIAELRRPKELWSFEDDDAIRMEFSIKRS